MGATTAAPTIAASTPNTLLSATASTTWIPREVRCPHCESVAQERVRERLSDEIAVRYGCPSCRWERVRHYHEDEEIAASHAESVLA